MRAAALGLLALLTCGSACAPVQTELAGPPVVTVRLGETKRIGGLEVRPIAVIEDSRCPRDVTCVWAGRLRLRAEIGGREAELVLGEAYAPAGGGRLTLVSAWPERWQDPPPDAGRGPATRFGFMRD